MTTVRGEVRQPKPGDFSLAAGYRLERLVGGLTWASNACVTPDGDLYVLEAGFSYPYVFTTARLSRVLPDGHTEVVAEDFNGPAVGLLWHEGAFLVTHRGTLSRVGLDGSRVDLVTDLPAWGDHHTNHLEMVDGQLYFGQGSATNAGFVGPDNLIPFGWLERHPDFCDVPPYDVTLTGVNMTSRGSLNPFATRVTGPFLPFDQQSAPGQVVPGQAKATGVIYRCNPDGTGLSVHAWGFRNPYSIATAPDGRMFCLDQGSDARGSRPLRSLDTIWEVKPGAWYGFPDFLGGRRVADLAAEQEWDGETSFVMAQHPERQLPYAQVPEVHAAAVQMQFAPGDGFGFPGHAFVACFGSGAPLTTGGKLIKTPQGVRRFDPTTRELYEFYGNENPGVGGSGPERPTAVRFSPDGSEMYVADYGIFGVPKTGALWRISRE
ncbi:MAG: glucose dehydrogenase [Actinobacteria bacterium]|nr:glucose dehydrogenase [Actinomycetota bacterium]